MTVPISLYIGGELMDRICIIFGAGDLYIKEVDVPDNAVVIAADGGLQHTEYLGIKPDIILGDFDSYNINSVNDKCIVYPKEKDYTDMFIAVQHGYDMGVREFIIYGGLGGRRIEHTVANLQLLEHFTKLGCKVIMQGDGERITALHNDGNQGNASVRFTCKNSGYISVFAAGGDAQGLCIKGLKYELENRVLKTDFPLGVSNEFCGKDAEISLSSGTIIIIWQTN